MIDEHAHEEMWTDEIADKQTATIIALVSVNNLLEMGWLEAIKRVRAETEALDDEQPSTD